jgi:hypothetical protein
MLVCTMNKILHPFGRQSVDSSRHEVAGIADRLPGLIERAGESAGRRLLEFFTANIRNRGTRMVYARAVGQFFDWCDYRGLELFIRQSAATPFGRLALRPIYRMAGCWNMPNASPPMSRCARPNCTIAHPIRFVSTRSRRFRFEVDRTCPSTEQISSTSFVWHLRRSDASKLDRY